MSLIREQARKIMQHYVVPVPQRDKTLRVHLPPRVVPAIGVRCLCSLVARRYWRVAHENRCTRIEIHDGPQHKHAFDTVDLMKAHVKSLGVWPARPEMVRGRVPQLLATRTVQSAGDTLDESRPTFAVPALPYTPVSGRTPAGQEAS